MITDMNNRAQLAAAWHYTCAMKRADNAWRYGAASFSLGKSALDAARMFARLGRELAAAECGVSYTFTMSPERP
jgi:hypothetical protein